MTEPIQPDTTTPASKKAKADAPSSHTIQTPSEIISVDEPETALPEVALTDLPQLLPSFTAFLRLRGEEHTVTGLSDAKRRFMYWMKSDEGRQAVKQLQITADAGEENDPYRYETLAGEQRTYMGRPIPADAPPRPNSWAVWDDQTEAWTR